MKTKPSAPKRIRKERTAEKVRALCKWSDAEMKRPVTDEEKAELEEDFKLLGLQRNQPLGKE